MSNAYLKPKANSRPQVIEYVWASDSNAIIVDLSGTKNSKLNANTASNNLTRLTNDDGSLQNIWSDSTGRLYNLDVSQNDISGSLFPLAFFVANESGPRTLTRVTGSYTQFTLPAFSVVDKLFTDASGTPWYTSYNTNVNIKTTSDISLTKIGQFRTIRDLSFNAFDTSNNKVTIDLSGFRIGHPDLSYNPFAEYDISLNLSTNALYKSYNAAKTDVSNELIIRLHKFGLGVDNINVTRYSNAYNKNASIDLSVNVLNASGVLRFDTSINAILNLESTNSPLQTNADFADFLPLYPAKQYTFTKSGRQNISIPFVIPAGASGCWVWNATLFDGNMTSKRIAITINIQPSFTAPIITLDPTTSLTVVPGLEQPASFNIKLDDNSFTGDISNNLPRGMLVRPRINAVNALVPGDVSTNYLNQSFIIKKDASSYQFVTNDLYLDTLTFTDISNGTTGATNSLANQTNQLIVGAADISFNPLTSTYFKLRDVSTNLKIDVSANDFNLPSRQFNFYLDWLPNAEPAASNSVIPQTSNIGTINVITTYSSNVNLVDNQDGTYSLSLSDLNGALDSTSYVVKVFNDAKCSIPTPSANFTATPQANVYGSTSNQFNVQMDSNFNATFTSPTLNSISRVWIVAYLAKSTNVHLYTASTPVLVTNVKFPTLRFAIADTNAFSQAQLNQIVNVTDNLDLNTSIADLSGYRINDISGGIDLSCNIEFPNWTPIGSNLKFTLNDNNGIVKSMDISANLTRQPKIVPNTPAVFTNLSDVSNNLPFYIDLSFNSVKTAALFSLDIAFSDSYGTVYPAATKTILFYYPGFSSNAGGNRNTLIVFNDAKYALDYVPKLNQMDIKTKDTFDCYTWTAGSSANTYGLNLARSEFVGNDHVLDASGFKIDKVIQNGILNSDPAALYIQYNGAWSKLVTTTVSPNSNGSGGTNAVNINTWIPCSFARNYYSWIDTRKFVGAIDIQYYTKDSTGVLSTLPNTLRLVVLPRPTIQASIATVPNVLVNTPSTLQLTLRNYQKNKAGANIDISGWTPQDVSGSKYLNGKFRTLLNASSGSISLVNASGAPDVANAGFFTLPNTASDILYGRLAIIPLNFKGRPTAGIISSNIQANYSMIGPKAISGSTPLQVVVYSTDSTFNNSVYTNNLNINTQLNFGGIVGAQYIALDNSNNSIVLDADSRTKNALFVIVENKGSAVASNTAFTSNVGYGSTPLTSTAVGNTAVYQHNSNGWTYLYSEV